jgi:putative tryptophan/tyrosine transport system substrate-binding protein
VTNLARPGGNVTGISHFAADLSGKQIDLFKEAVPGLLRIGVFYNPTNPLHPEYYRETEAVAQAKAVSLFRIDAWDADSLERAAFALPRESGTGLLVLSDPFLNPRRVVALSVQAALPMIAQYREYADAGGLLAYGPSLPDALKRAAVYVHKILSGTTAGDLPFEQPSRFELVVNLNAAKALGLTAPQSLLLRADEVIE